MKFIKNDYFLLVVGCALLFFSGAAMNIAVFGFIWPACLILFLRREPGVKRILLTMVLFCFINALSFGDSCGTGSMVISGIFTFVFNIVMFIPFVVDALLSKKNKSALSVLILPLGVAVVEFLLNLGHLSLINNLALTQAKNIEFIQFASIVGTYGLSAIVAGCSSVIAYVVENECNWEAVKKVVVSYAALMMIVMTYGGYQVSQPLNTDARLKVAMALGPVLDIDEEGEWINVSYEENVACLEEAFEQASAARAEVIAFNEESFCLADVEKDDFVKEISSLAKKYGMYVNIPLEIYDTDGDTEGKEYNNSLFFNPDGSQVFEYSKSNLVPVIETGYFVGGDGNIPTADINGVKVAATICYDGDFSNYIRTMDKDVAIWFNPSWEWDTNLLGITPSTRHHYVSLVLRAVENGVNLVKSTYDGASVAADYQGNILANANDVSHDVCVVNVPVKGVTTIYQVIGGVLNWMFVGAYLVVIALSFKKKTA